MALGALTLASCSVEDDDTTIVPKTPNAVDSSEPVSWLARATTFEELQEVEEAIGAIRGAGYTYRDNESYCVGTDMEVFNMRNLREMEQKYQTSYLIDDYMPTTDQKFFYSSSAKDLKDTFYKAIRIIKGYGPKLTRNFKTKPGRKSKAELEAAQEA